MGDILTVTIAISDNATIANKTTRTQSNTEDATATNFLGYEPMLSRILPTNINPAALIDLDSSNKTEGNGNITHGETITLKVAAVVTHRLPNGNLALQGRHEIQVNFEVRELQIAGVIRLKTSVRTIRSHTRRSPKLGSHMADAAKSLTHSSPTSASRYSISSSPSDRGNQRSAGSRAKNAAQNS